MYTHRGGAISEVDVGLEIWSEDWVTAHITTAGWLEGGRERERGRGRNFRSMTN